MGKDRSTTPIIDIPLNELNKNFLNATPSFDPVLKANALSEYSSISIDDLRDQLYFKCVDNREVRKVLGSLKSNANGSDRINARQWKLIADVALPVITHIIIIH